MATNFSRRQPQTSRRGRHHNIAILSSPSPSSPPPQYPSAQRYFDQYSPERQQHPPLSRLPFHSFDQPDSATVSVQPPQYAYHAEHLVASSSNPQDYPSSRTYFNQPNPEPPPAPPHRSTQATQPSQPPDQAYDYQPKPSRSSRQGEDDPAARARTLGYTNSVRTASTATPGADNLGDAAAGGGIAGIAYGVAQANERESGVRALQAMQEAQRRLGTRPDSMSSSREDNPYVPEPQGGYAAREYGYGRPSAALGAVGASSYSNRSSALAPGTPDHTVNPFGSQASLSSDMPRDAFAGGLGPPGRMTGRPPSGTWIDTPYQRRDEFWDTTVHGFNPNEIEDDGADDALHGPARTGRRSMYPGIGSKSHSSLNAAPVAGAAAGAGIGAAVASLANRDTSGKYGPVGQGNEYIGGHDEKDWEVVQAAKRKKRFWMSIGIAAIIILVIVGAVVGGVLGSRAHGSGNSSNNKSKDPDDGTVLNADSPSVKALLNDNRLHRVFPGIAYTPLNAQYPECLSNMPIQNNVTKDIAILSQLTDTIRLYGTDCNQTELVLEAFNLLKITDMKVWLAVWLNGNQTTNDRGVNAMNDLVKKHGADRFKGVIIGNEVLYRKELTSQQILNIVANTRSNFSANSVNLPIAVADLGDNWTADMAKEVDVVMSNIHPFFGGVPVDQAAGWAWTFWQGKDVALTKDNTTKQNIISEIGWPTGGGNDCGVSGNCTSPTEGAVASVDNMNTFMQDFVCQSITNKTDYFWFEAFDEPWKAIFNTDTEKWETQWGLFDKDRNFKNGLKIPDCGGQKPAKL